MTERALKVEVRLLDTNGVPLATYSALWTPPEPLVMVTGHDYAGRGARAEVRITDPLLAVESHG